MQFYLMGSVSEAVAQALVGHGHKVHRPEATVEAGAEEIDINDPGELLPFLADKQWNLVTLDGPWLKRMYEEKVEFPNGIIVHLLDAKAGTEAIDRLFERYKRLTPKRLYTVTGSRVKIRQLPGLPA